MAHFFEKAAKEARKFKDSVAEKLNDALESVKQGWQEGKKHDDTSQVHSPSEPLDIAFTPYLSATAATLDTVTSINIDFSTQTISLTDEEKNAQIATMSQAIEVTASQLNTITSTDHVIFSTAASTLTEADKQAQMSIMNQAIEATASQLDIITNPNIHSAALAATQSIALQQMISAPVEAEVSTASTVETFASPVEETIIQNDGHPQHQEF